MCYGTSSGTLTQLIHFGPLIAIFLISYITISGLYCLLLWWPPTTLYSIIHLIIYCTWPIIIFYNYFNAIFLGPGFVPKNWKPANEEDEKYLQYCKKCESFKAPRSHHCRKCNRCVLKMDHHCPWINTCVGHRNHSAFVYFVFYAPLGCLHAILVLGPSIYRALFRNYYIFYEIDVPIVKLNFIALIVSMFALGMAFGVTVAVFILFAVQMSSIWKNETGIESWIIKKATFRRKTNNQINEFVYPYNLGRKENYRQVFNWDGNWRPIGNGIWWNIRPDCSQFDLTIEQLYQKEEKRVQSVKYNVINEFNGAFIPINKGCKVCCCIPWSDDPRLKLSKNEVVFVTRWQKHWLYGEKIVTDSLDEKNRVIFKGWFPSSCVTLHEDERVKYSRDEEQVVADDKKEK